MEAEDSRAAHLVLVFCEPETGAVEPTEESSS
jgi:hypothetical protein